MMKSKDVSVAAALVINGYLRANDTAEGTPDSEPVALHTCLGAVQQEVDDWADGLDAFELLVIYGLDPNALEPAKISIKATANGHVIPMPRTPYNLVSAALTLIKEAHDLHGDVVLADLVDRLEMPLPVKVV